MKSDFELVRSWALVCKRCGYHWVPKATEGIYEKKPPAYPGERPSMCPKCKSKYWDTPKA